MVHGNEQKKQIEAAAQLFPAEGMEIELFDLCAGKEQRALAEEMAGADLEIAKGSPSPPAPAGPPELHPAS